MLEKSKKFIGEVVVELKKVSWSTRQELIDATWIVVISTACLMVYIGAIDFALSKFLGVIIK
jgi:preprotein translocase SecE subunit